jgi:hypothetical protein
VLSALDPGLAQTRPLVRASTARPLTYLLILTKLDQPGADVGDAPRAVRTWLASRTTARSQPEPAIGGRRGQLRHRRLPAAEHRGRNTSQAVSTPTIAAPWGLHGESCRLLTDVVTEPGALQR